MKLRQDDVDEFDFHIYPLSSLSVHGRSGSCAPPCCSQPLATFMHGRERPKHATWRSNLEIIFLSQRPEVSREGVFNE